MSKFETNTIDTVSGTSTLQVGSTNTSTITLGVSGDTINVPSGVTIANSGTATGFGGTNTPSFMAKQTGTQNISSATWTKVQFNSEVFDTDGTFDSSSNFRWTPGVAGKYFMYLGVTIDDLDDGKRLFTKVYKNGSGVAESLTLSSSGVTEKTSNNTSFIDIADADDYYEGWVYHNIGSAEELRTDYQTIFMGYKIIE